MSMFNMINHVVGEAYFIEHSDREKKTGVELGVDGEIIIPKDITEATKTAVNLKFHLGSEDERLFLVIKTVTTFDVMECCDVPISEDLVKSECVPIALAQLRNSIKTIMEAYGRTPVELPPFEDEFKS